ncbi:hypothetical protein [Actinomadura craniellae]|uniref:hypothetical protein n=1 Tax=Actinomadura craniellae TaxID=2231787 RepID=UPI0011BEA602|nr:hypothetical protein [Actinomadura craniellae]
MSGQTWRTPMRRALRTGSLLLAGLLLTGCSLFGGEDPGGGALPKIETDAKGNVKGAVTAVDRLWGGYEVHVDILSLRKYDKALRLVFAVIPRAKGNNDEFPADAFGGSFNNGNAGGVGLVDTEGLRAYQPMVVGKDGCACSSGLGKYPLDTPTLLYVDFPVPPAEPDRLTVVIPKVGPIPGVKVS